MTYKEALFFIGKCLTITHEEHHKVLVENELKSENIDWDSIVKVSTAHYVFPALYCNLKRAAFLHYLPEDLVAYMKHITDLNRERNQQIIEQAKEINELLLAHNISPIFLKGTGNLLEGLYEDIGERMVGDIDFIVQKEDIENTLQILKNQKYKMKDEVFMEFHWHYSKMVKKGRIASLEVHKRILKKEYDYLLDFRKITTGLIHQSNLRFLSTENKILNAILPKIINDNLYYSQNVMMRTMYDVYLLSRIETYTVIIKNKRVFNKFNNICGCIKMVLNNPQTIKVEENKSFLKFKKSYLLRLDNSKKVKLKSSVINYFTKYRNKIGILGKSFTDEEYRSFVFRKLQDVSFYKKLIGVKPKPNP
jgi:hypothetical protein